MSGTEVMKACGANTRQGGQCKKPAGWGTPHPGIGTCRFHLGSTKLHIRSAARVAALEFARGHFGQELDADPLEGVLMAVRLSYGIVDSWRHKLAIQVTVEDRQEYARAVEQYARICKLANDAGVSDRQIRILERMAEQLSLAFEEALPSSLVGSERAASIVRFGQAIARLEAPAIEGTAEDVAA